MCDKFAIDEPLLMAVHTASKLMKVKDLPPKIETEDILRRADGFLAGLSATGQNRRLEAIAPFLWKTGIHLDDEARHSPAGLGGLIFQYEALLKAPETLTVAAREILRQLYDLADQAIAEDSTEQS